MKSKKLLIDVYKRQALGWILIIADAVAFFIGGKTMLVIFIMVLMITYAVYIKYYPYIFIAVSYTHLQMH